ncbi:MAG: bifunctional tRNA (5-methylaminomethyl-2-thiouridine)(34)-methyltransferase MnmD/FAD-dependent 5-carboxymethylaminomethyl-2-thiouridine(34) oxidoreductase MnmC [Bacteriovoracia bacterium]
MDTPYSNRYGDYFFSKGGALAEKNFVFLEQNRLPERFARGGNFQIGELGFGYGVNFLLTARLWRTSTRSPARLRYFASELHPLTVAELGAGWDQILGDPLAGDVAVDRTELAKLRDRLMAVWPPAMPGFHLIDFLPEVQLVLMVGEAFDGFRSLRGDDFDAWYLDGFSPAKNPEMWSPELFSELARRSRVGKTTFSTYSAAGKVRRDLESAGFAVERVAGFAGKRELLRGSLSKLPATAPSPFAWAETRPALAAEKRAIVVGAGLAGVSVATALARRDWEVTVLDRGEGPAVGASGNARAVYYPLVAAQPNTMSRYSVAAFGFLRRQLAELSRAGVDVGDQPSGLLQLEVDERTRDRFTAAIESWPGGDAIFRYLSADEAAAVAGVHCPAPALYFPAGGSLDPRAYCRELLAAYGDRIQCRFRAEFTGLTAPPEKDEPWRVHLQGGGELRAPVVVLANALDSLACAETDWLPFRPLKGQVDRVASGPATALKAVLSFRGYLTPAWEGAHLLGASHDRNVEGRDPSAEVSAQLRDGAVRTFAWAAELGERLDSRVSIRTTTPDHFPIVGPAPDARTFLRDYAGLQQGRDYRRAPFPPGSYWSGLYLNLGFGSRGLVYAPLAGEILASEITGEACPVEVDLHRDLAPARFLIRCLSRPERYREAVEYRRIFELICSEPAR